MNSPYRLSYTNEFKLNVIDEYNTTYNNNASDCSRNFNIPRTCLVRWLKDEHKLRAVNYAVKKQKRLTQPNSKARYKDLEIDLVDWVKKRRESKQTVDYSNLREQARFIIDNSPDKDLYDDFLISNNWIYKFFVRNDITYRNPTNRPQENNKNKNHSTSVTRKERIFKAKMSENRSHIVWVDLEMSGLNIDKDHILEMACLITDSNLKIVAEGPELIIKQSDEVLNGMDEWCSKHHGESGLTESVKKSQISIDKAEKIMLDFIKTHVPEKCCPLAGNSIHMDRIFLNKYMKKFLDHLHYRIIDVSTIKELSNRWYPEEDKNKPVKKFSHRALEDIKESINELKFYQQAVFKKK